MVSTLIAVIALVPLGDPPKDWETIAPEGGGFSVAMPPNAFLSRKKTGQEDGPSEVVFVQADHAEIAYVISYVDHKAVNPRTSRVLLDGTRDLMLKSSRAKLTSEKPITLGKAKGREIRATVAVGGEPKAAFLRARIYLAGNRLYQVMATGTAEHVDDGVIQDFFDSFKLVPAR